VKEIIPNAHLSLSRGTEQQNRDYCLKDSKLPGAEFQEHGNFEAERGQGQRTDIEEAVLTLKSQGLKAVAEQHPTVFLKFHSGLEKLQRILLPAAPLRRSVVSTVLWGLTGTGKTHRIRTAYPDIYIVRPGRDPFGSYSGQLQILFEEFNPEEWKIQDMNCYLDVWSCELNCRYFNKHANWEKVFINTNINPDIWYPYEKEALREALFRRIAYKIEILNREQELLLI